MEALADADASPNKLQNFPEITAVAVSGGNLMVLLTLTGIAAIILGMGMTTTAVYITVAALIVPSLIESDVAPMAEVFLYQASRAQLAEEVDRIRMADSVCCSAACPVSGGVGSPS